MRKFNFKKRTGEIEEWLLDSANKELLFDDSIEYIKGYLASDKDLSISTDTSSLSSWCLASAIRSEIRGELSEASRWLQNALYACVCGYGIDIDYVLGGHYQSDTYGALGSVTEPSIYMAFALRLGRNRAAGDLYKIIYLGKQKDYFFEDRICLSTFVSGVYEYMTQGEIDLENHECDDEINPYMKLLSSLSSNGIKDIDREIYEACDFHVEHSCASSSRRTCEFEDDNYAICPVEIFLIMDVLKTRGFDVSKLSHPLIDTPLKNLGTTQSDESFDYIRDLYELARKKINTL
jgi:hypothetical protein